MNLFFEEIKIRTTWVGILMLSSIIISSIIIAFSVVADPQIEGSNTIVFIVLVVEVILFFLFFMASLKVNIDLIGVGYQWFPLMLKSKRIHWDLVEYAWVRKSSPLKEFGGWGIKGTSKNRAINVSGEWGLQLVLSDAKRIFIETRNPEEVRNVLAILESKGTRGMNKQPNE